MCAGVAVLSIVAAACGSSSSKAAPTTKAPSSNTTTGPVPTGGTLTVGAEQEPDCMDWVGKLRRFELGLLDGTGHHHAVRGSSR